MRGCLIVGVHWGGGVEKHRVVFLACSLDLEPPPCLALPCLASAVGTAVGIAIAVGVGTAVDIAIAVAVSTAVVVAIAVEHLCRPIQLTSSIHSSPPR